MKLLLTGAFSYSDEQLKLISDIGNEIIFIQDEKSPLPDFVFDIDGIICNSFFLYHDIKLFKNLKYIQLTSTGLDRVPLKYIIEKDILLFNAHDVYSIPMAEWAVLKILEIYKKTHHFYKAQKNRSWDKNRNILELFGKSAAIIGFGNIGKEIAKRLKAFDVNIFAIDIKYPSEGIFNEYIHVNDINCILPKCDIIILTLPLCDNTKHFLNSEKINILKNDSVLINISRGALIDEKALIEAIDNGKFIGVSLDVFEYEPLSPNSKLWDFDNVIITPHNSFISEKNNERLFELIYKNLKENLIV